METRAVKTIPHHTSLGAKAALFITLSALGLLGILACTPRPKDEPANTLHIAFEYKVKGLDPALADDIYAQEAVSLPYEGLLQYHYLKRPPVLVSNLADGMPEVRHDGLVYTFHIKEGVLFQDDPCFKESGGKGRELTAEDFIYSWKRIADPKNASPGYFIFDGRIVGLDSWRSQALKTGNADYTASVEGLRAIDRYTLRVTLTRASAQFPYFLAMPFSFVVPKEAVEFYGAQFLNHPVGTGPYRLSDSMVGSRYVWDRNPTYRLERYPSEGDPGDGAAGLLADAGKPLPLNDRIVLTVYESSQPLWLSFMSGRLDISQIPKDNYSEAVTSQKELTAGFAKKGIQLVKGSANDVSYEAFNMLDPVVGGFSPRARRLRQAISLGLDHDVMIDLFFNGRAITAEGPIPPGISGYDPGLRNPYRHANLARARALLALAGYPGGRGLPPIVYLSAASTTDRQLSELFSKMLSQIGVKLDVHSLSWPQFTAAVKEGNGQLWGMDWYADYPDAENFLQLLYGRNARPGSNDAAYANPEFDRLYEKALHLADGRERTAIYQQMVSIAIEDAPWIFGVHRLLFYVAQPWVRDYKLNSFDRGRYKYIRVSR